MDLNRLIKGLFYKNGKFSLIRTSCLSCVFLLMIIAVIGTITPDAAAADQIPNEFKNTEKYQILEFENSICAVDSYYDMVLNETNEKNFTNTLDSGSHPTGVILSIKELNDDSSDINPSDLKEPNYRDVKTENVNIANTPVKKVRFIDTNGGETTNENWIYYNIYTFDKNGKHYQMTSYSTLGLLDSELEKIIESFTKK